MDRLIFEVTNLMDMGVYDPEVLYQLVQNNNRRKHYSTVRRAVHLAKTKLYK